LGVGCHDHLKILDDALRVAVFFSGYVNESMGVRIVCSQNIEPLPSVFVFEDRRRFGVSPTKLWYVFDERDAFHLQKGRLFQAR